jgi:hypothetical protein
VSECIREKPCVLCIILQRGREDMGKWKILPCQDPISGMRVGKERKTDGLGELKNGKNRTNVTRHRKLCECCCLCTLRPFRLRYAGGSLYMMDRGRRRRRGEGGVLCDCVKFLKS